MLCTAFPSQFSSPAEQLCPGLSAPVWARWSRWGRKRPPGLLLLAASPQHPLRFSQPRSAKQSHLVVSAGCKAVSLPCGPALARSEQKHGGGRSSTWPQPEPLSLWRARGELQGSPRLLRSELHLRGRRWVDQSLAFLPGWKTGLINQHLGPIQNSGGFYFLFLCPLSFFFPPSIPHKSKSRNLV